MENNRPFVKTKTEIKTGTQTGTESKRTTELSILRGVHSNPNVVSDLVSSELSPSILVNVFVNSLTQPEKIKTKLLIAIIKNPNAPSQLINDIATTQNVPDVVKEKAIVELKDRLRKFKDVSRKYDF